MLLFVACNSDGESKSGPDTTSTQDFIPDTTVIGKDSTAAPMTYSNERFRNVTVAHTGDSSYRVRGEGQIFEASFGWVVEDGHNEIKEGFTTTDAGAPEWGKFDFTFNVTKQRPNSTLHLVIFETSMKDGSRVHELVMPLAN